MYDGLKYVRPSNANYHHPLVSWLLANAAATTLLCEIWTANQVAVVTPLRAQNARDVNAICMEQSDILPRTKQLLRAALLGKEPVSIRHVSTKLAHEMQRGWTHSAEYWTSKLAGWPAHVAGALPPEVWTR